MKSFLTIFLVLCMVTLLLAFLPGITGEIANNNIDHAISLLINNGYTVLAGTEGTLSSSLIPSADNTYDLGSNTNKWRALYLDTTSLHIGSIVLEDDNGVLTINGKPVQTSIESNSLTVETDPIFMVSPAYNITSGDIDNWESKLSSYIETDPIFAASSAYRILGSDISNWNAKLSSYTETDPLWVASASHNISLSDIARWDAKLSSYTETDPVFLSSVAYNITSNDITSWNSKLSFFNEVDPLWVASVSHSISSGDISNWNNKLSSIVASSPLSGAGNVSSPLTVDLSGYLSNTTLSAWVGSSNIATLGTITSGVWHGDAIIDSYIASASTWNGKLSSVVADSPLSGSGTSGSHLTIDLSSYVPTSRTVNSKALYSNITLTASDVGAMSNTLTSTHLFVGNGSNVATDVTASGDVSLANTGAFTVTGIQGKAVTLATGFLKYIGSAWSFDNSTYLTGNQSITLSGAVTGSGATSITTTLTGAGLDNVFSSNGLLKRTGANTYTVDTNTYLTGNQSITLSGVLSGSGTTSITASYASAPSCKTGITTRDISTASGTQTIAHGLGRTPTHVYIMGQLIFSASISEECKGYYDGTNHSGMCVVWAEGTSSATTDYSYTSTAAELGFNNVANVNPFSGATKASGIITVDATNITITWTKSGSPTGTVNLMWEVQ